MTEDGNLSSFRDGHGDPRAPGYRGFPPNDEVLTLVGRPPFPRRFQAFFDHVQEQARSPFRGVTTDGEVVEGLYPLAPTGLSLSAVRDAAVRFLDSLDGFYRGRTVFPIDAPQWRLWDNIGLRWGRHGMWFLQMTEEQRAAAFDLISVALGEAGVRVVREIMRVNAYLEFLTRHHHYERGELLYRLSLFGSPADDAVWGFQIDGHHCNVNYVVIGDQVVMSPRFFAAEPVFVDEGPDAGLAMFQVEQQLGLDLMRSLSADQERVARVVPSVLKADFPPERYQFLDQHHLGGQARDNQIVPAEGISHAELTSAQQSALFAIVAQYLAYMPDGHRELRLAEVAAHLDETTFVWMGDYDDVAPFYYRIQSPVIMLEFDHQSGASLSYDEPSRLHIHTLLRTPNGNDYGMALRRALASAECAPGRS